MSRFVTAAALNLCVTFATQLCAQTSSGANWNSNWGFRSANDVSIGISRANAIRQAELGPSKTVITTTNYYETDNRSNYVDITAQGDVASDYHIGDVIDQNTNAVGSMNTGSTTIEINGSQNSVIAENTSTNDGCVDGSILNSTLSAAEAMEQVHGGTALGPAGLPGFFSSLECAQ